MTKNVSRQNVIDRPKDTTSAAGGSPEKSEDRGDEYEERRV